MSFSIEWEDIMLIQLVWMQSSSNILIRSCSTCLWMNNKKIAAINLSHKSMMQSDWVSDIYGIYMLAVIYTYQKKEESVDCVHNWLRQFNTNCNKRKRSKREINCQNDLRMLNLLAKKELRKEWIVQRSKVDL